MTDPAKGQSVGGSCHLIQAVVLHGVDKKSMKGPLAPAGVQGTLSPGVRDVALSLAINQACQFQLCNFALSPITPCLHPGLPSWCGHVSVGPGHFYPLACVGHHGVLVEQGLSQLGPPFTH